MRSIKKGRTAAGILAKTLACFLLTCLVMGGAAVVCRPSNVARADSLDQLEDDGAFDLSEATITVEDQTYTGSALTPAVTVALGDVVLAQDVDYTVAYENNINAGTAAVTITGTGTYGGEASTSFNIAPANISGATIEVSDVVYTNSYEKPTYSVRVNGATLQEGIDYTASFSNNSRVGTATATFTGIGNYEGSISRSFTVNPRPSSWCYASDGYHYYTSNGTMLRNSFAPYEAYPGKTSYRYVDANGNVVYSDWVSYGGKWYYVGYDGLPYVSKWVKTDGQWYYLGSNGAMLRNSWLKDGGKYYYMGSDGAMLTDSWVKYNNKWYYLNSSGNPVVSQWVQSGGKWYYLGSAGAMLTSQWISGKYWVGADGAYDASKTKSGGSSGGGSSSGGTTYVLNTNSMKFHYSWCSSAKKISSANRWNYSGTRAQIIAMGYTPCKNCNP